MVCGLSSQGRLLLHKEQFEKRVKRLEIVEKEAVGIYSSAESLGEA
jgi:hypothetical protein